jgi:hypothetical protein
MRFCALVERHSLNTRTLFIAVNEGYIKETFYMKYIFFPVILTVVEIDERSEYIFEHI